MAIKHNQQIPHNRMFLLPSLEFSTGTDWEQISERIGSEEFAFTSTR
jgi:hypothetical protein